MGESTNQRISASAIGHRPSAIRNPQSIGGNHATQHSFTTHPRAILILAGLGLCLALILAPGSLLTAPAAARPMDAAGAAAPALLQFTAGGHVVGFGPAQVVVAGLDHALRVEFVGAAGVQVAAGHRRYLPLLTRQR